MLDAGWTRVPTSANFARQKVTIPAKYITEAGYYFTYLSYEGESNNYVYFDDYQVRHVKSNLIQGNEYYPFGMQTANSWTRENVTGNNYLANGGTELNQTSQLYDLHYRNYDATLGRMFQVDPMASKYSSITPYNYSLNNPANMNDPLGDDVEPQPQTPREYICAMCWREGNDMANYMRVSGGGSFGYGWGGLSGGGFYGGSGPMGQYWHPGDGRMFWSGYESYARGLRYDADAVRYGDLTLREYGSRHGTSITTEQLRSMAYTHNNGVNPITGVRYTFNTPAPSPRLTLPKLNIALAKVTLQKLPSPTPTVSGSSRTSRLVNPTGGTIRQQDGFGEGRFGASRNRNGRSVPGGHLGIDITAVVGQEVSAIVEGSATAYIGAKSGIPWIEIVPSSADLGFDRMRILYVSPLDGVIGVSRYVGAGDIIGTSVSLPSLGYPNGITPHVHVEFYNGSTPIDPTPLLFPNGN